MEFTLQELAKLTDTKLVGNPTQIIKGVADLSSATPSDISFLANGCYLSSMKQSLAGAIFIDKSTEILENKNFLISDNPSKAFQIIAEKFFSEVLQSRVSAFTSIHKTAILHETVQIEKNVAIAPYAVLDHHVSIHENSYIGPHVYIAPCVQIGRDCYIHANVTIREGTIIGDRVIIQPGAVIGSCGFGYTTDKQGRHEKLQQIGNVVIEDDVEIGANTTIDRARFKTTLIGQGSKIDNLVQIAHGVILGTNNLLAAQSGVAGSTKTSRNVVVGGQSAVAGHLSLADGTMIAGKSGVTKSLTKPGEKYSGFPALPKETYNRLHAHYRSLEKYANRIKALEQNLAALEKAFSQKS